jgi:hypothetical protein
MGCYHRVLVLNAQKWNLKCSRKYKYFAPRSQKQRLKKGRAEHCFDTEGWVGGSNTVVSWLWFVESLLCIAYYRYSFVLDHVLCITTLLCRQGNFGCLRKLPSITQPGCRWIKNANRNMSDSKFSEVSAVPRGQVMNTFHPLFISKEFCINHVWLSLAYGKLIELCQ